MQLTTNLKLKKPESTDAVNIDDLNGNADTLDAEVVKLASATQAGRMTAADKTKLAGIAAGAQVNAITSVAGRTGAVVLTKADVGLASVDNAQQATKTEFNAHVADSTAHITSTDRTNWNAKASTAAATSSAAGLMSAADKSKLDGVASGANNYSHPATHPPSIIAQDASNRFVTDAEKSNWNAKAGTAVATASAAGLMAGADKSKLDGIAAGATNYSHPATHPPSIIAQDANNRFATDAEKSAWNAKASTAAATSSAAGLMAAADKSKLDGVASGAQVNRSIATQAQAIAGTDNATSMTPLRVREAIDVYDMSVKREGFARTTGTATAFIAALDPPLVTLEKGVRITLEFHLKTGANPTVNCNSKGAKALMSGSDPFEIDKEGIASFVYNGTNFQCVSGGGGGKLNAYTGTTKPSKYEGVYIETNTPITSIRNDLDIWLSGAWSSSSYASIPVSIREHGAVAIGSFIYLFGGATTTGVSNVLYRYSPSINSWTTLAPMPEALRSFSWVAIADKIYVMGGVTTTSTSSASISTVYRYDVSSNTWTTLAPIPIKIAKASAAFVGDNIYLMGGATTANGTPTTNTYAYNIVSNTWTLLAAFPERRAGTASVGVGTLVYLFGGSTAANVRATVYCYDTLANDWSILADIPFITQRSSVAAVGKDIYLFGGASSVGLDTVGATYDNLVRYDTQSNTWATLQAMSVRRVYHTSTFINGLIYVMGGDEAGVAYSSLVKAYALASKSYAAGTLVINRINPAYGQWQTELVSASKGILGVNTRLLSHFDDVFIHDGTTLRGDLPSYYGNGSSWVKFKN